MDRASVMSARIHIVDWVAGFLDCGETNAEIDIGTHVFRIAALPSDFGPECVYRLLERKADQEEIKWTTVIAGRPNRAGVEAWVEKQRLAATEYIAAQIPREIPEAYGSW